MNSSERGTPRAKYWVDGVEGGAIPADDPGILLGLTAFETVRTYGRVVFRLQRHLERLEASAALLDVPTPSRAEMTAEIERAVGDDVRIRYTLTAGGHRIVEAVPLDLTQVAAPIRVAHIEWEPPKHLPGAVKHGSRAAWIITARRLGVDEVLLVDRQGFYLEANRSNIVAVSDGVVRTPPIDGRSLEGVTRGALLDAAKRADIPMSQEPIHRDELLDELYLSSTLKHLAPVAEVDGQPAPGGGPVGDRLYEAFLGLVAKEVGSI